MLYFLVYVSSARTLFSRADLDDILLTSRRNNTAAGISGILLYKDGNLMQVLEGEKSAVQHLYDTISRDARHGDLTPIWDGEQSERQFPDWTMAFRDLSSPPDRDTPGYSDFLSRPLDSQELTSDPSYFRQLITLFKTSM